MNDERYNGWKNWETWNAHLWITNEEPSYITARAFALGGEDDYAAGQVLKEWYEYFMPDLSPSFWDDCLTMCFQRIDWQEIAASLRE